MGINGEKNVLKRMGDVVLKSKSALLLALFVLPISTQIVKANPSPPPEEILIEYFLNNFFIVFLLTIGVEFVVVLARGRDVCGRHVFGVGKTFFVVAAVNLLSLSCLWLFIKSSVVYYRQNFLLEVLVLEFTVVAVEALVYKFFFRMRMPQALILSFLANLTSYFAGLILFNLPPLRHDPWEDLNLNGGNNWE